MLKSLLFFFKFILHPNSIPHPTSFDTFSSELCMMPLVFDLNPRRAARTRMKADTHVHRFIRRNRKGEADRALRNHKDLCSIRHCRCANIYCLAFIRSLTQGLSSLRDRIGKTHRRVFAFLLACWFPYFYFSTSHPCGSYYHTQCCSLKDIPLVQQRLNVASR